MLLFIIFSAEAHSGDRLSPLPKQDSLRFYECAIRVSFLLCGEEKEEYEHPEFYAVYHEAYHHLKGYCR